MLRGRRGDITSLVTRPYGQPRFLHRGAIHLVAVGGLVCLLAAALWGWGTASHARVEARPVQQVVREPVPADGVVALPGGRTYHLAGDLGWGPQRPLIVVLGGLYLSSTQTEQEVAASPGPAGRPGGNGFSNQQDLTVVYADPVHGSWNAGGCCGYPAAHQVDDVGYLASVVADVSHRVPVDPRRVYLVGFSIGGMLAERAACSRPELYSAAVSIAGPLVTGCPEAPRILHIAGARDTTMPLAGGYSTYLHYPIPAVAAVRNAVLAQHPQATYDVLELATLGHKWPTTAANNYSTLDIGDWLLAH